MSRHDFSSIKLQQCLDRECGAWTPKSQIINCVISVASTRLTYCSLGYTLPLAIPSGTPIGVNRRFEGDSKGLSLSSAFPL